MASTNVKHGASVGTAAASELERVIRDLVGAVATEGNTRVVFGEPLALETHKIIPVASVQIGFGGGMGASRLVRPGILPKLGDAIGKAVGKLMQLSFGGGAGAGIKVTPLGFICERGDEVRFEPISASIH